MLIDWFTVLAQILNFLILVWLMKRFLYQPILRAIDEREARIASELADAATSKAAACAERDAYRDKNAAFDQQREARLRQVAEQAHAERQRLLESARQEATAARAEHAAQLHKDALRLNETLKLNAHEEIFAIARRVLTDLATANLEARIVTSFAQRLETLDDAAKAALGGASGPVTVLSAFELGGAQRSELQRSLDGAFGTAVDIDFQTAPYLISGIELLANGHKIAWSIADYLGALEHGIADVLDGGTKPAVMPGAQ